MIYIGVITILYMAKADTMIMDKSTYIHQSGYKYQEGEHLIIGVEATHKKSNGWLLQTDKHIIYKYDYPGGVELMLKIGMLTEISHTKGVIKISWIEDGKSYDYSVRLKKKIPGIDQWMLNVAKYIRSHAKGFAVKSEEDAKHIREIRITVMQDDINIIQKNRDILQKQMDFLRNKDPKQYIQQVKQAYQLEDLANEIKRLEKQKNHIATMPIVIANCVPENISPEYIWNDAWYDEERDVYFTHSKIVVYNLYGTENFLDDSLTAEATDYGALIPAKNVIYAYGYPCVRLTHQHGQSIMPLATMTEEMLTTELVNANIGSYEAYKSDPDGFEGQVEYITEADRIYDGDFTEKEKQIGQESNNQTTHDDVLGISGECKCKYCVAPTPKPKLGFLYPLLVYNFNRPLKDVTDDEYQDIHPSGKTN